MGYHDTVIQEFISNDLDKVNSELQFSFRLKKWGGVTGDQQSRLNSFGRYMNTPKLQKGLGITY